jgi:hypothetical protein
VALDKNSKSIHPSQHCICARAATEATHVRGQFVSPARPGLSFPDFSDLGSTNGRARVEASGTGTPKRTFSAVRPALARATQGLADLLARGRLPLQPEERRAGPHRRSRRPPRPDRAPSHRAPAFGADSFRYHPMSCYAEFEFSTLIPCTRLGKLRRHLTNPLLLRR